MPSNLTKRTLKFSCLIDVLYSAIASQRALLRLFYGLDPIKSQIPPGPPLFLSESIFRWMCYSKLIITKNRLKHLGFDKVEKMVQFIVDYTELGYPVLSSLRRIFVSLGSWGKPLILRLHPDIGWSMQCSVGINGTFPSQHKFEVTVFSSLLPFGGIAVHRRRSPYTPLLHTLQHHPLFSLHRNERVIHIFHTHHKVTV